MKTYLSKMKSKSKSPSRVSKHKVAWSWLGAFLGLLLISITEKYFNIENLFIVGSFGATAVLIYGAPTADFSQPRNVLGGHVLSASVGVTIALILTPNSIFSAPLAVSLAIALMHATKTLHPPGGATALIAVIGGEKIHSLGYGYVLFPILTNSILMIMVALIVNNFSRDHNRHYPIYWW